MNKKMAKAVKNEAVVETTKTVAEISLKEKRNQIVRDTFNKLSKEDKVTFFNEIAGQMPKYNSQLREIIESILTEDFYKDATNFYGKNNSSAGFRVRKGLNQLRKVSFDFRKEVQDVRNQTAGTKRKPNKK